MGKGKACDRLSEPRQTDNNHKVHQRWLFTGKRKGLEEVTDLSKEKK